MDELFGIASWRPATEYQGDQRKTYLLDLYQSQLKAAGFTYTYAFDLRDKQNKTEYFLVHGTKHLDGLAAMKKAMWDADPTGNFSFSDWTESKNQGQGVLIGNDGFDPSDVQRRLCNYLEGKDWVDVNGELREWLLVDTPYHDSQYKQKALALLSKAGQIEVSRPNGKTAAYWNTGTLVRLTPRE